MIIVEGMDNTGKTTLIEQLVSTYRFPVKRSEGYKGPERLKERQQEFYNTIEPTIFDRLPAISDEVYGRLLRGKNCFDPHPYSEIAKTLRLNPIIIYCRPETDDIFNFGTREQMEGVVEQKQQLLAAYDNLMTTIMMNGASFACYNWRCEHDLASLTAFIDRQIVLHQRTKFFAASGDFIWGRGGIARVEVGSAH